MSLLVVPNTVSYIPLLQSFIIENAKIYRLDEKLFQKLRLVAEESFLHIIKNSFEENESGEVEIQVAFINSYFEISFFDKGLPLDPSLLKEYSKDALSTEGIELFLVKEYTDKVTWINHGSKGKEFKLSFKTSSEDIFSIVKNEDMQKSNNITLEDIDIRVFKNSDAVKISRIIYRAYGYTYPNEDMYYPEKILELNRNGELISVVCYDKKNDEVVGHYALERPNLGSIVESGQAVVSPQCRGLGLMKKMRVLLENIAKNINLEGIYSQPVTSHTYSQQVNLEFGSSPCGFSFGLVPQRLSFKQINSSLSQRESCFLYFHTLSKRDRVLYLPKQHNQIVQKIYENLKLPYTIKDKSTNKKGLVVSSYSKGWGIGVINVEKIGYDNFKNIKEAFYNLLFTLKADVIFLNITLEDESIDELITKIENEKFFFAGIHPSLIKNQDAIRFEFLNGVIDESKIKIYEKTSFELFAYISNEKKRVLL
ncbi:MAG: ATP-binding protein [Campylobacterales bacterium]